jgi:hypothetical protein
MEFVPVKKYAENKYGHQKNGDDGTCCGVKNGLYFFRGLEQIRRDVLFQKYQSFFGNPQSHGKMVSHIFQILFSLIPYLWEVIQKNSDLIGKKIDGHDDDEYPEDDGDKIGHYPWESVILQKFADWIKQIGKKNTQ